MAQTPRRHGSQVPQAQVFLPPPRALSQQLKGKRIQRHRPLIPKACRTWHSGHRRGRRMSCSQPALAPQVSQGLGHLVASSGVSFVSWSNADQAIRPAQGPIPQQWWMRLLWPTRDPGANRPHLPACPPHDCPQEYLPATAGGQAHMPQALHACQEKTQRCPTVSQCSCSPECQPLLMLENTHTCPRC